MLKVTQFYCRYHSADDDRQNMWTGL